MDDMLIKSKTLEDHLINLEENFSVIKTNKVRINLAKCTFGVAVGKFLEFMLIERGIEMNPTKCKAILEMRSLTTLKKVHRLNGGIAALSHFMSRSAEKCIPFYKMLKKDKTFAWGDDCKKAFSQLKEYLYSPPILTRPKKGELLYLYITTSEEAVGTILIVERNNGQKSVYYTSKVLHGAEERYQRIKKLAYAVVLASKRLNHYLKAHSVVVRTDQPIHKIL